MKPAVVLYKVLPDDLRSRLNAHFDVIEMDNFNEQSVRRHADKLQHAQGLIGSGGKFTSALLDTMPNLRAASTISAGYDQFNVDELNQRGIVLMHTPHALTETVADLIMGLMLDTARRLTECVVRTRAGEWRAGVDRSWFGVDVHHKTLGIVGMGRIGMALAQRAHLGFSMPVLYNARRRHADAESRFNAEYCELDDLLTKSDFVCIILPLSEQTHHMIGGGQLAKMKSSAFLINAGRGPVVDEAALISALENGVIGGAGLDVYEREPLAANSPLLAMPNVVPLPHIGSATHETRYLMAATAVDNLINALAGNVKGNCVNPQIVK